MRLRLPVRVLGGLLVLELCGCGSMRAEPAEEPRPAPATELVARGDWLRRHGMPDAALDSYRQAIEKDPYAIRAHAGLQDLLLEEGLDLEVRRTYRRLGLPFLEGRLEAFPVLKRAAFARAKEPWRSLGFGIVAAQEGRMKAARRHLREAVAADPGLSWSRIALGRVLLAGGRLGEAEEEFRSAAWSEPANPTAPVALSLIADRRGDLEGATAWAFEAYRRGPGDARIVARVRELALRSRSRSMMRKAARLLGNGGPAVLGQAFAAAWELYLRAGEREKARQAQAKCLQAGMRPEEVKRPKGPALDERTRVFLAAFRAGVEGRYRHYLGTREAEPFEAFVAWARDLYVRKTGRKLGAPAKPLSFSFVGELMDPGADSNEPLVRALAARGLLLILGRRRGGPPEALLASIVKRTKPRRIAVRGGTVRSEIVWTGQRFVSGYTEWAGGGDVAGLALPGLIVIDVQAVARWRGDLLRRAAKLKPVHDRVLEARALIGEPVDAVVDPAGVAGRLLLVAGTGTATLAEEVRIHEAAHLVDARRHLPVGRHPFRNLGLVLSRGFSPDRILAYLERNAQLAAIAEEPEPRLGLAVCCFRLGGRDVHSLAYAEIVKGFVNEILAHPERYPAIDPGRVVVQQLHRLEAAQVRSIAWDLMERWGVNEGPRPSAKAPRSRRAPSADRS